jgi:hypothetical protein
MRRKIVVLLLSIGLIVGVIAAPASAVTGNMFTSAGLDDTAYVSNLPNPWLASFDVAPFDTTGAFNVFTTGDITNIPNGSTVTGSHVCSVVGDNVRIWHQRVSGGTTYYYAGSGNPDTTVYADRFIRNTIVTNNGC